MGVREGLERLEGVETIAETADDDTQTCRIRMRGGRLPDLEKLAAHLRDLRVGATLRGAEAAVEGRLVEEAGELRLRVAGTGEILRLAPLRRTVYWHAGQKRPRRLKAEERAAFSRLRARRREGLLRVVGPLAEGPEGRPYTLEVRRFEWRSGTGEAR